MTPTITVYSRENCVQCDLTKNALKRRGLAFVEESIDDPANMAAAKELGFLSAPVVMVGDEGWAGFQPERINNIEKAA